MLLPPGIMNPYVAALLALGGSEPLSPARQKALLDALLGEREDERQRALTRFASLPDLSGQSRRTLLQTRSPAVLEVLARRSDLSSRELDDLVGAAVGGERLHRELCARADLTTAQYLSLASTADLASWAELLDNASIAEDVRVAIASSTDQPADALGALPVRYSLDVPERVARAVLRGRFNLSVFRRVVQGLPLEEHERRRITEAVQDVVTSGACTAHDLWDCLSLLSDLADEPGAREDSTLIRDAAQQAAFALLSVEAHTQGSDATPLFSRRLSRCTRALRESELRAIVGAYADQPGGAARQLMLLGETLRSSALDSAVVVSLLEEHSFDELAALLAWFCGSPESIADLWSHIPPFFPLDAVIAALPEPAEAVQAIVARAVIEPAGAAYTLRSASESRFLDAHVLLGLPGSLVCEMLPHMRPAVLAGFLTLMEAGLASGDTRTFYAIAADSDLTVQELLDASALL